MSVDASFRGGLKGVDPEIRECEQSPRSTVSELSSVLAGILDSDTCHQSKANARLQNLQTGS